MEHSREREHKPASWTARVFAILAVLGTVLIVFLVIDGSLSGSNSDGKEETQAQTTTTDACEPDADKAVEAGYYVLEAGEDLSVVADKTCVELSELLELNPNLDPQQLEVSSCIDLVADGCKALAEG